MRQSHGIIRGLLQLPFTLREMPVLRTLAGHGIALGCMIALFTFIGPFGTYDTLGAAGRVGYWAMALGLNWLVCGCVMALTLYLMRGASIRRRMTAVCAAAAVAAAPGTGIVFSAETLFRPLYTGVDALPTVYVSVAVLMLVIGVAVVTVRDHRASLAAQPEAPQAGRPVRFLGRLPPRLGRDLVYLRMADHYVEVFTTSGSTLLLMRFSDALRELDGADGLRVHRSYWVARTHVSGAARRNGRLILKLSGGHEAPVSRTYLAAVRAAGIT